MVIGHLCSHLRNHDIYSVVLSDMIGSCCACLSSVRSLHSLSSSRLVIMHIRLLSTSPRCSELVSLLRPQSKGPLFLVSCAHFRAISSIPVDFLAPPKSIFHTMNPRLIPGCSLTSTIKTTYLSKCAWLRQCSTKNGREPRRGAWITYLYSPWRRQVSHISAACCETCDFAQKRVWMDS
jgi:hypothetical protein